MPLSVTLNPVPQLVAHDPLGRAMTEEQRQRLREQPSPPVEETMAREKIADRRRRAGDVRSTLRDDADEGDDAQPGTIIDGYA